MKKALVVDDKKENRRLVAEALVRYGFTDISEAENGQQAVEQAVSHKSILIVMDVGMPVMDGITAAEKISKKAPAPIVLLTGKTYSQTVARAFSEKRAIAHRAIRPSVAMGKVCRSTGLRLPKSSSLADRVA